MTTRSNTLISLCKNDSHKIKDFSSLLARCESEFHQIGDLSSLLFFKVGVKNGYVPRFT